MARNGEGWKKTQKKGEGRFLRPLPTQLSLSPLSECLNSLKKCRHQFAFRQVNRKEGGCADITLRRIMAKSQRHSSEERWIIKHGTVILNDPYVSRTLRTKKLECIFRLFGLQNRPSTGAQEKKHARFFYSIANLNI